MTGYPLSVMTGYGTGGGFAVRARDVESVLVAASAP